MISSGTVYPHREKPPEFYGPTVDELKALCWEVRCPPKIQHFLWQILSGCIAVLKNLKARGIQGDICCARCGKPEESINHVFFKCPPARQVWALSKIPSSPNLFPTGSVFGNMDHLFWRVNPKMDDHHFAWILWYIWKGRNNKVFSNLDVDPRETLRLAELESTLWAEAHVKKNQKPEVQVQTRTPLVTLGSWCFIDGSWKDKDIFSGQSWYSTLPGFNGLLGVRNVRACLSPLHSEIEALIWAMQSMRNLRQFQVTFATDCSQLVKKVSEPEEWPVFKSYLKDVKVLQRSFYNSEIVHVPRTENKRADSLARSARKQSSFVVHMDAELPVWFTESS